MNHVNPQRFLELLAGLHILQQAERALTADIRSQRDREVRRALMVAHEGLRAGISSTVFRFWRLVQQKKPNATRLPVLRCRQCTEALTVPQPVYVQNCAGGGRG